MQIAFYGEETGIIGNLVAMAYMAYVQKGYQSLIMETRFASMDLDFALLSQMERTKVRESAEYFHEVGMDAVISDTILGCREQERFLSHIIEVKKHQLYYLPGTYKSNRDVYEKNMSENFSEILGLAEGAKDLLFLNCQGEDKGITRRILESADIIVYNLSQTTQSLEALTCRKSNAWGKTLFLIGQYDADSRYHINNIRRKYNIPKERIAAIPYNVRFMDALSQGRAVHFLEQNLDIGKKDYHYSFMGELMKASGMLLREVSLHEDKNV